MHKSSLSDVNSFTSNTSNMKIYNVTRPGKSCKFLVNWHTLYDLIVVKNDVKTKNKC